MTSASSVVMVEARKYEAQCKAAQAQIARATTVSEVVRSAQISVPSYVRMVVRRHLNELNQRAEQRITAIMMVQLDELDKYSGDLLSSRREQLRQDWHHLRGYFPRLSVEAHRHMQKWQKLPSLE